MVRPELADNAVIVTGTFALHMARRRLQSSVKPDPLDLLMVQSPPFDMKQLGDLAMAVSSVSLTKSDENEGRRCCGFTIVAPQRSNWKAMDFQPHFVRRAVTPD